MSAEASEPVTREQRIDQWLQRNYAWTHDVSRDEAVGIMAAYAAYEAGSALAPEGQTKAAPDYNSAMNWLERQFPYPSGPRAMTWAEIIACLALYKAERVLAEGQ